ncbi:MAG: hypothetical protein ABIJ09_16680 [Pseudomonadota bacterium]
MRLKIAAAAMLVAALALVGVTLVKQGHPLGYRGRAGVVREVVGTVEVRASGGRPERATPASWIAADTEVRTGDFSSASVETARGTLRLYDSTGIRSRRAAATGPQWLLDNGRLHIEVDHSAGTTVGSLAAASHVELLPGSFHIIADGKGLLCGLCVEGTALVHEGDDRPTEVKPGQVFILSPLAPAVVTDQVPDLALKVQVAARTRPGELPTVSGHVTPGSRVYVNGEVTYPDSGGEFMAALSPGEEQVVVVAEDISGSAARKVLVVPR